MTEADIIRRLLRIGDKLAALLEPPLSGHKDDPATIPVWQWRRWSQEYNATYNPSEPTHELG